GRIYKISSNSWDCTGGGISIAYHAGAELIDMEFVQFHPTGMVWPPSVRGLLITEGVRGEGGVLRNKDGKRFMFDDIPDLYKNQTSMDEEEGWRYTQGDKNAKRPPELLTRDHVARCIRREVKAGRGSPHGGVFLDIAWIKEKLPNASEHIKRKLPSMYHQFKELAGVDITKEPMEVGPTTHYIMGGVKVDADSQMTSVSGLFATGECAAGLHGANRLGGNSLSDLLVFGKRAGEHAALYAKENREVAINENEVNEIAKWALSPFERGSKGENPFEVQDHLQEMMQDQVGIVRIENELTSAIEKLDEFESKANNAGCNGNRGYNPGWHTAIELKHMVTVAKAIAISAKERKESRGGHFREDFQDKSSEFSKVNVTLKKDTNGKMIVSQVPKQKVRDDLQQLIEEMK
ncbi:MAG: FAD-binding protein, partial [Flammeovirgaceae bacterium]|nr:FAD-binding protein [Flammeovirgaceae bacterium]